MAASDTDSDVSRTRRIRADGASPRPRSVRPPSCLFGEVYEAAALSGLFQDSKTLADAAPRTDPEQILAAFRQARPADGDALRRFFLEHFELDPDTIQGETPPGGLALADHIEALWPFLTRAGEGDGRCSRLPLPHPFVVPGGRFSEIYYWDSYFTMLGLGDAHAGTKRKMVENFAHMLRVYGRIPNGARSYYLSRSQPPVFYEMVALASADDPAAGWAAFLDELMIEHQFWSEGRNAATPGAPARRVVRLPDGSTLNRFWDDLDRPRDESFGEDVALATISGKGGPGFFRHIRAAAESGWDFSTRWFADGRTMGTIQTTDLVPPCLNSLLYGLERAIADGAAWRGDRDAAREWNRRAERRAEAIETWLWNAETGCYDDLDWTTGRHAGNVSCAAFYPLFSGLCAPDRARRVAATAASRLLQPGGLVATDRTSDEQWDSPNGWAPLHWIAVEGLEAYGETGLAGDTASRWLDTIETVFADTGRLMEKYDVAERRPGGGGEYPVQDGFGWTNGVTVALRRKIAGL
ncbi:MAG: alpha,alpha-trehalase TreF [Oceanicaulis sp.]